MKLDTGMSCDLPPPMVIDGIAMKCGLSLTERAISLDAGGYFTEKNFGEWLYENGATLDREARRRRVRVTLEVLE